MRIGAAAIAGVATCVIITAPAWADSRPVPEGDDARPCVTYAESNAITLGMNRARVRRVLDARGHRVPVRRLDSALAGFPVDASPEQRVNREVREYPTCAEDEVPAVFFVEFNHRRGHVVSILWL